MNSLETAQFRATTGDRQAFGTTPQEAFNALMALLPINTPTPIVIWPYNRGDVFFTEAQIDRLQELKSRRDTLTEAEREELEGLIEASFDATIVRTLICPLLDTQ